MVPATFHLQPGESPAAPDNRRRPRRAMATTAVLRDRASNKYQVQLFDLSVTGFRAGAQHALEAGAIVWLTIPGMQGLEATVAWRRGIVIGCHFRQPLHPAVFDHIVARLGG